MSRGTDKVVFPSWEQFYAMPRVEWLIEGVLPKNAVSALYADTGAGKSFVAVDWVGHVLTGKPWMGREVKQGAVLYVMTEAVQDFPRRMAGWQMEHGVLTRTPFFYEPDGIQLLNDTSVNEFLGRLTKLSEPPVLIVIDTLGQAMVEGIRSPDGDKDRVETNRLIRNAKRISQAANGAAVLLISHTTKDRKTEAGSAALRQGVFMLAHLEGKADDGKIITLKCNNMKTVMFEDILLLCKEVTPPDSEATLVLVDAADGTSKSRGRSSDAGQSNPNQSHYRTGRREKKLRISDGDVLNVVREHGSEGIGPAAISRALGINPKSRVVNNHLATLFHEGKVKQISKGKYVAVDAVTDAA